MNKIVVLSAALATAMSVSLCGCSSDTLAQYAELLSKAKTQTSENAENQNLTSGNEPESTEVPIVESAPQEESNETDEKPTPTETTKQEMNADELFNDNETTDNPLTVLSDVSQEDFIDSLTTQNLDDVEFLSANLERFRIIPRENVEAKEADGILIRDKVTAFLNLLGDFVDTGYDDVRFYFGYTEQDTAGEYVLVPVPMPVFPNTEIGKEDYINGVLQLSTSSDDIMVSWGTNINSGSTLQDELDLINDMDEMNDEYYTISTMNEVGTAFWSETYSPDYDSVVGEIYYMADAGDGTSVICRMDYSYDSVPETPRDEQVSDAFMDLLAFFDLQPSSAFAGSLL